MCDRGEERACVRRYSVKRKVESLIKKMLSFRKKIKTDDDKLCAEMVKRGT